MRVQWFLHKISRVTCIVFALHFSVHIVSLWFAYCELHSALEVPQKEEEVEFCFSRSFSFFNGTMQISRIIKMYVSIFKSSPCMLISMNWLSVNTLTVYFTHSLIYLCFLWKAMYDFWHRYPDCMNEICLIVTLPTQNSCLFLHTKPKAVPNIKSCEHISHSTRFYKRRQIAYVITTFSSMLRQNAMWTQD